MRELIAVCVVLSLVSCASTRKGHVEHSAQVETVRNGQITAQMESIADAATIEKVIELYVEATDSNDRPKRLKVVRKITTVEKRDTQKKKTNVAVADSSRVTETVKEEIIEKRKNRKIGKGLILGLITSLVLIIGYKLKNGKHN